MPELSNDIASRQAQAASDLDQLKPEEKAYIAAVRCRQEEFQSWIRHNKRLSAEQLICFQHADVGVASRYWLARSQESYNTFEQQHEHGWRSWTRSVESVARTASQFMRDFKPLVDAASNSGPYAAAAIGVCSGFFAIVKAKRDVDDIVSRAMAGILDRLPGCDLLEQVYDGPDAHEKRLRQKIILTYAGIVDFAIAANRYYLQPGSKRWLDAVFSSDRFAKLAGKVQSDTTAVRLASEEILPAVIKRIRLNTESMRAQNDELKLQNEDLKSRITRLQKDSTDRSILQLQELLGLQEWSADNQREKFREYEKAWDRARHSDKLFQWVSEDSCDAYIQSTAFKNWENLDSGLLLILCRGNTRSSARSHCWLSPVSWHFMSRESVKDSVAYKMLDFDSYTDVHVILSEIVLQLLGLHSQDLISLDPEIKRYKTKLAKRDQMKQSIGSLGKHELREMQRAQRDARDAANDALQEMVKMIASCLDSTKQYYIVLDRVDRCEQEDQLRLLIILLEMIQASPADIKVLAIANELYWEVRDWQQDDLVKYESLFNQTLETQSVSLR